MANPGYCPWCGGGLSKKSREVANQTRQQMRKSVLRSSIAHLIDPKTLRPLNPQAVAKHPEPIVPPLPANQSETPPVKKSPNRGARAPRNRANSVEQQNLHFAFPSCADAATYPLAVVS